MTMQLTPDLMVSHSISIIANEFPICLFDGY